MTQHLFQRRPFLRGLNALIALPALEAFAQETSVRRPRHPLIFIGFPYGVTEEIWFPKETGSDYAMPKALKPLEPFREHFSVLSNLSNLHLSGGVHNGTTTFLTSANWRAHPDKAFQNSISCDQVAAEAFAGLNRYPSLELTCRREGGHGKGLSLAWNRSGDAIAGEHRPLAFFHRLFGDGKSNTAQLSQQMAHKKSILDTYKMDYQKLHHQISARDRQKMDEYFHTIRQMERRLEHEAAWLNQPRPKASMKAPQEKLGAQEHIRTMYDLMVVALQTQQTQVLTFRQPMEELLKEVAGPQAKTHPMSHYKGYEDRRLNSEKRDMAQSELLAHLFHRMQETEVSPGVALLDHALLAYGTGIRCVHDQQNLPIILAGRGAGNIKTGQHFQFQKSTTPLSNLWLTMLRSSGVKVDRFADSQGVLEPLMT